MQVEECVKKLKSKGIIDSREIYIYASLKNIIGGMFGSIRGLVLLCIICMERYNIQNIMRIIGNDPEHKVQRLLDYTNRPRDIADPWYTGNFDETFDDVMEGCQAFLSYLMEHLQ